MIIAPSDAKVSRPPVLSQASGGGRRTKSAISHEIEKGAGKRLRLAMKMQFTRDDSSLYAPCPKSPSASQFLLSANHHIRRKSTDPFAS